VGTRRAAASAQAALHTQTADERGIVLAASGAQEDLGGFIEELDLSDLQKHFLRSRWLNQVSWMEGRAKTTQRRYYALHLTIIIGGVIIPALVSLNLSGTRAAVVDWGTFALSLVVAISAAVDGFFRFGERWRHYRRTAELLKSEGWQFFQLSGPSYDRYSSHAEAYHTFAARVEDISRLEVEAYITEVVRGKAEDEKQKGRGVGSSG